MRKLFRSIAALCLVLGLAVLLAPQVSAMPSEPVSASEATSDLSCLQPPNNVDHATFTPVQLDMYGLPHRKPGETLSHWQQLVRAAKYRYCAGRMTPESHHRSPTDGTESSRNWSGYVATNYGYQAAFGDWRVPCLTLLLKTGYSSAWIGLGGDPSDGGGNLVQDGTESNEYQDAFGRWVADYYAWTEDYPNQLTSQYAFGVNCGDSMTSTVSFDSSVATMFIGDTTNGNYVTRTNTNRPNGSTAEWILERPTVNKTYPGLSDFRSVSFTGDAERNGSDQWINNLPYNEILYMYGNSGTTVLATTGGLSNEGDFTVTWNHYGP